LSNTLVTAISVASITNFFTTVINSYYVTELITAVEKFVMSVIDIADTSVFDKSKQLPGFQNSILACSLSQK
jgi:hypothetical protein